MSKFGEARIGGEVGVMRKVCEHSQPMRDYNIIKSTIIVSLAFILAGCATIPSGVEAVRGFDASRYEGRWYEIARLDHDFERGLSKVSATYTLRDDGGIDVLNKGFDEHSGSRKEARGRAYFLKDSTVGCLKVSFFWPFYGGYNVISLDRENYSYALVCGPNRSYLWILARDKTLSHPVIDKLVKTAKDSGFKVEGLIFVEHDN
ncbi:MAG: lipocalin family protein [Sedimentisphaerales bacterium]